MLITTSRRPSHRARLLGRELARVIPKAEYIPRGVKSVRGLASLGNSRGHKLITVINSREGQRLELSFLDIAHGWRWLDTRIELSAVELQREIGQKVRLDGVRIVADPSLEAQNFAGMLSRLWGLPLLEGTPGAGAMALVTDGGGLRLQFHSDPGTKPVGPILYIECFG